MSDIDSVLNDIHTAWSGHRRFAEWLVKDQNPQVVVDLGVDTGFSSLCWAAAGARTVYGVDSFHGDDHAGFRDTMSDVLEKIKMTGLYNLNLVKGYFTDVALNWNIEIDILHIDGRHDYEDAKADYLAWRTFLKPDGVVLFHDTCVEHFGVRRLFKAIRAPKINLMNSHGLGILCRDDKLVGRIQKEFHSLVEENIHI